MSRCQSPCSMRRGSAVVRFLGLGVRIPLGAWTCVSCGCCVLSSTDLFFGPITRPEYGVCQCDRQASIIRGPCPTRVCCAMGKEITSMFNSQGHKLRAHSRIQQSELVARKGQKFRIFCKYMGLRSKYSY